MERQIRELCRGLGDVNVVRVDSANADNFKHIIDHIQRPVPNLQGHHPPSLAGLDQLERITFDQLTQGHRHLGTVLHVTVSTVQHQNGAVISARDENDAASTIWSLLLRLSRMRIGPGMKLAIKEPYFGRGPSGELAVCVHHHGDCILVSALGHPALAARTWKHICSMHGMQVRASSLGGRGIFANKDTYYRGILFLERDLALAKEADAASYGDGVEGILQGERTNGRKLALLQEVVDMVEEDEALRRKFFDLHAGEPFADTPRDMAAPFDTYRALSIIKHNAHTIFLGNTSDHHDVANKPASKNHFSPNDQTPGIWLEASRFNHSCLPNCTWSWTGSLFVARANRNIAADEELTVAYVPTSYDFEKRQSGLKTSNSFVCSCPLCKADKAAARTAEVQEAIAKARRLPHHIKGASLQARVKNAEDLVQQAVMAYPRSIYTDADGHELPCVQLADPFYHLAHVVLDRAKNGFDFKASSSAMRSKAREYFIACVEIGLGYRFVFDTSSPYCELLYLKYSLPRPIGVLALVALAELAFVDGDRARCCAFKACAKTLYGICYGEDATFKKQHLYYSCKDEPSDQGKAPSSEEWNALKVKRRSEPAVMPTCDGVDS